MRVFIFHNFFFKFKARVPDYDLLPVNSVNQTLLLLRDILESPNYGTLSVNTDKREIYNKVYFVYFLIFWKLRF